MFSKNQHIDKSIANREFAESIPRKNHTCIGWAITALFYSALHRVDAYFSTKGVGDLQHKERNKRISQDPDLAGMYGDYRDLFTFSYKARYTMACYNEGKYAEARKNLSTVQEWIDNLLLGLPTH